MLRAFYSSAAGMKAQELLLDVTANNIANVNTNGFKRSHVDFADLLYATHRQAGAESSSGQTVPIGLQVGSGVRAVGTTKHFTPGSFQQTGNPLDVAIQSDAFFKVNLANGEIRYTRDGAFHTDGTGQLVTSDGNLVDGGVNVPLGATNISVGKDGTVSATVGGAPTTLGTITVVRFPNPAGLSSEGSNLFAATGASGQEVPVTGVEANLQGGWLEQANVEVVTELVSLITAQRAYEVNSRAIRAGDEMLSNTNNILR